MAAVFTALDELPRQNASRVKNKWGEVVRQVQAQGSVAVTNHSKVEMVLVDAATYHQMVEQARQRQSQEQALLQALDQRFDARLAGLQQDGAADRLRGLMAARGRSGQRPRAGASF